MSALSRRSLVTSAAALPALGEQLESIAVEVKEVQAWVLELSDLYYDEVWKLQTWPDDQAEWMPWDAQAYCDALKRIEETTEIGMAYVRASNAEMALDRRIEALCEKIKKSTARSAKERAFKRWASAIHLGWWPDRGAAQQREQAYRSHISPPIDSR